MSTSRWQTVSQIFEAVLDLPVHNRPNFVREACGGNSELESEVIRLLTADEKAASFLERPALSTLPTQILLAPSPLLSAGLVVAGRFQVVRFIGQGGMGQVYEALDVELNSRIALKAIRPEIAADPRMLSRFRREVQLTRMITHPNVCRTFDIERHASASGDPASGESVNLTFLTMELLEGETLSARLRRASRFTPAEALPLALQMIDALAAAHAVNVIHRDFKPSNVLLVPIPARSSSSSDLISARGSSIAPSPGSQTSESIRALRVVVTDFGLARAVATHTNNNANESGPISIPSSLTGDQALMGTLVYMAPEQFERGEASVASDIYSLGLVLFEMLTGQRPFADDLAFAEAAKRLKQAAPSAATLVPDLDPAWDAAIARCLALNPKDRYANVRELADALTDTAGVGTSVAVTAANAAAPARASSAATATSSWARPLVGRRKYFAVAAIAVLLVSLFGLAFRHYWMKAEEAKLAEGSTVLLTDIQNGTGDTRFDSTTELVRRQLLQSPYFSLMDSDKIHKTLSEMLKPDNTSLDPQTAREVAMRNGVRRVVFGTVSRVGDSYVLDLDIEQPDNSPLRFRQHWQNHWTWSMPGSTNAGNSAKEMPSGFLEAIRDSSDWIRHEIGESANDIAREDSPPEDVTTASWEALSEFTRAEKFRLGKQPDGAVKALRNAVAADPNFALAYARLGDILISLSRFKEGYAAYDKSLALGKQRLTRRERDGIRGIRASDAEDYATADAAFEDYSTYYRNDYLGWFFRAFPLMRLGKVDEAISCLKKANELDPSRMSAAAHIARYEMIRGNYLESNVWVRHLREYHHFEDADIVEGELDFVQGRYDHAAQLFSGLTTSKVATYGSLGYSLLARLQAEMGRYSEAFETLRRGIDDDSAAGDTGHQADKLLDRAYLHFKLGHYQTCLQEIIASLALDQGPKSYLAAASLLGQAAIQAKGAERDQIIAELKKIQSETRTGGPEPFSSIARVHLQGEIFLVESRWDSSLGEFQSAKKLEARARDKGYLARALLTVSQHVSDRDNVSRLRAEALGIYSDLLSNPAQIWQWSLDYPPGYLSDATFSFIQAKAQMGVVDDQIRFQLRSYLDRRATADNGLADVEEATRLGSTALFERMSIHKEGIKQ